MNKLREYQLINDPEIRKETVDAISKFPDYFWDIPASTTYQHHNPYCCDEHGLWIHTKMVCTEYLEIVPSLIQQGELSEYEADCGLSACIIHDSWKAGEPPINKAGGATTDHDLIASAFIKNETELPKIVADAVASHMGPWYYGPEPSTTLEQMVHIADMSASSKNITPGLYKPHSDLTEFYPSLAQATFDPDGVYE